MMQGRLGRELEWALSPPRWPFPPLGGIAPVTRRLAILDDNQRLLEERLAELRATLPRLVSERMSAAMVIGSVAEGRARDASDLDLLVVLRHGLPRRSDYSWWDESVAPRLGVDEFRFPVQPVIVGRSALTTADPQLARALHQGIVVWDPEGLFHDQPRPGA